MQFQIVNKTMKVKVSLLLIDFFYKSELVIVR